MKSWQKTGVEAVKTIISVKTGFIQTLLPLMHKSDVRLVFIKTASQKRFKKTRFKAKKNIVFKTTNFKVMNIYQL